MPFRKDLPYSGFFYTISSLGGKKLGKHYIKKYLQLPTNFSVNKKLHDIFQAYDATIFISGEKKAYQRKGNSSVHEYDL